MAAIDLHQVRKRFGDVQVLRGIDLAVRHGEFIVLVGPSGCGKSTLLRLIAGLEEITSGEIRIGGRLVNDLSPKDRDIAMVFQSYALYPHMTVRDNMSYSLRRRGWPRERISAAVKGASAKLGLDELLERKPKDLSGGQRQRVAMGRALVREPQAFLFDEPLSNLDARLREQMRYEIRKLHREVGATAVYVTHDQIEAMTMADRIVAMNDGIAQQIGTPAELYDDPANRFVAEFIGSPAMNFLDAGLRASAQGLDVEVGGVSLGRVAIPADPRGNRRVMLGIRPERVLLTDTGFGPPATVDLIEPTGLGTVVHLDLAGQPLKLFTTARLALAAGVAVALQIQPADLLLFDRETGVRLRA
jgi:multiple sugar transport system ATP-binding protein